MGNGTQKLVRKPKNVATRKNVDLALIEVSKIEKLQDFYFLFLSAIFNSIFYYQIQLNEPVTTTNAVTPIEPASSAEDPSKNIDCTVIGLEQLRSDRGWAIVYRNTVNVTEFTSDESVWYSEDAVVCPERLRSSGNVSDDSARDSVELTKKKKNKL